MSERLYPIVDGRDWSGAEAREDLKRYALGARPRRKLRGSGRWTRRELERYARGFAAPPELTIPYVGGLDRFKLPIANVYRTARGHLVLRANRHGIEAAAAALEGARGGVELDPAARRRAYELLGRYYRKMGDKPPWPPYGPNPAHTNPGPATTRPGWRESANVWLQLSGPEGEEWTQTYDEAIANADTAEDRRHANILKSGPPGASVELGEGWTLKRVLPLPSRRNAEQLGLGINGPATPAVVRQAFDVDDMHRASRSKGEGYLVEYPFPGGLRLTLQVAAAEGTPEASRGEEFQAGDVIAYHPRKSEAARAAAAAYEFLHGQKVPKGTRWLAVLRDKRDSHSTGPRQSDWRDTAGITAHTGKRDAVAALRSHAGALRLNSVNALFVPSGPVDPDPELTTAAELSPPEEPPAPTDLTPPEADLEPAVEWIWQPAELGACVVFVRGLTSVGEERLLETADQMLKSHQFFRRRRGRYKSEDSEITARILRPTDRRGAAVGGSALLTFTGRTKADRDALVREDPGSIQASFTKAWTELFGGAALDAYEETHWGEAAKSIELVEPKDLTPRGSLVGLGELVEATYRTTKGGGDKTDYVHTFGETGAEAPLLAFDEAMRLFIVGGGYTVTSAGIEG